MYLLELSKDFKRYMEYLDWRNKAVTPNVLNIIRSRERGLCDVVNMIEFGG